MALKIRDGTVVFECTEEDMRPGEFGGYVLPSDPRAQHEPTKEEKHHLVQMWEHFQLLKQFGWNDAMYAPRDGRPFLSISAGSTGVHECVRHDDGHFWIYDGDLWPANPILWKPLARTEDPPASAKWTEGGEG